MFKLKGDKDGFAGRYEHKETGLVWTVNKFYFGRGVGAAWTVEGKWFGEGQTFGWSGIAKVVKNWQEQGVEKVA